MGLDCPTELVFCCGDTVLDRIEDAGEQVTAVRDGVMGLLGEFLRHVQAHDGRDLPELAASRSASTSEAEINAASESPH